MDQTMVWSDVNPAKARHVTAQYRPSADSRVCEKERLELCDGFSKLGRLNHSFPSMGCRSAS